MNLALADCHRQAATPMPHTTWALDVEPFREHLALARRKLKAGDHLYRAGQPFNALYLVHEGLLKSCLLSSDGREQVTGFRMRGELLGAESIGLETYGCDVVALADTEVWCLPYYAMLGVCTGNPALQSGLTAAVASEVRRDHGWMLAIGTLAAERRVAAFLLNHAAHCGQSQFVLAMGRADIASFLAVQHETVTRALAGLARRGLIAVSRRQIRLLDANALRVWVEDGAAVH